VLPAEARGSLVNIEKASYKRIIENLYVLMGYGSLGMLN